jgi:hypothetical protein
MRDPGTPGDRSGLETKLNYLLGYDNDSEGRGGVRVVEHLMLRTPSAPDFDWFRISVFLAGWKAPWNDANFRRLAAEELAACCPAHVTPDLYWLDSAQMQAFDDLYELWWTSRRLAVPSLLRQADGTTHDSSAQSDRSPAGSDAEAATSDPEVAPVAPVGPKTEEPPDSTPRAPGHSAHVARRHTPLREFEDNAKQLREFIERLKGGAGTHE